MIQQKCSNWIQHFNFDTTSVLHPWIPVDAQFAAVFMDNFCEALVFLIDNLPGSIFMGNLGRVSAAAIRCSLVLQERRSCCLRFYTFI